MDSIAGYIPLVTLPSFLSAPFPFLNHLLREPLAWRWGARALHHSFNPLFEHALRLLLLSFNICKCSRPLFTFVFSLSHTFPFFPLAIFERHTCCLSFRSSSFSNPSLQCACCIKMFQVFQRAALIHAHAASVYLLICLFHLRSSTYRLPRPLDFNPLPPGSFLRSHHLDGLWVQRFDEDSSARGHALHQLVECCTFDLLSLQVGHAVQEVKQHAALLQLLAEEIV